METRFRAESNLIETFKKNWTNYANIITDILLDRYNKIVSQSPTKFQTVNKYNFWCEDFDENTVESVFKHGSLSIGFIGLSETFEILTGNKFWQNDETYKDEFNFVK